MQILFISNEYPPDTGFGGIGTYTRYTAEEFVRQGHRVFVISRSADQTEKTVTMNGVTVCRVPVGAYPLPTKKIFFPLRTFCYKTIPQALWRLAWAKSAWNAYRKLAETQHFHIIEYPDCGAEGYYFRYYLPCVVRLHTPWAVVRKLNRIHEHPIDRLLQTYLERFSIKKTRVISSPSHALARYLRQRWGLKPVTVFPNPIPSHDYRIDTHGGNWLYTGRIEYRKGVHILLQAYAEVCATRDTPPLFLVGRAYGKIKNGKNYETYIKELIEKKALQQKVTWIPGVAHEKIAEYLKQAAVAFFPSLWENFPYSCLEAMAAGVVPCASDCGGYPEMIEHGGSGMLFKAADTRSLVGCMNTLLDSPDSLENMSASARKRVEQDFDSSVVYEQAKSFYESALKERD